MHALNRLIVILSCSLTLCQTQSYRYPVQSRPAYGHRVPSTAYYSSFPSTSSTNTYNNKQVAQRNLSPYASSRPYSDIAAPSKAYSRNSVSSKASSYPNYSSSSDFLNTKQYLSNSYNGANLKKDSSSNYKNRVSKADAENSKFVGAENQEKDNEARTLSLKRRKFLRRFGGVLRNPCFPYGRDTASSAASPLKEQGRFLWDINVYNIHPQTPAGLGCGGYGGFGGGLGAGLLSDPIDPPYYRPDEGIVNFLSLFAPGILQNSLGVPARPQYFADYGQQSASDSDLQNDPEVDPNYRPGQGLVSVKRRPNRLFYDSAGAPPLTPAKLVGGVSSTVNGIIQQLTGNIQPAYV